jgi:hypothetical protein
MKPRRNDACRCGSGVNHKKCCLPKHEAARSHAAEMFAPRVEDDRVRALDALTAFCVSRKPPDAHETVRLFGLLEPLPDGVSQEDVELKFYFYLHFDAPFPDGRSVAETFLGGEGRALPPHQQEILTSIAAARLRVYEVQDVRVDEGVSLRDLRTDDVLWVRERLGSRQLQRWDLLGARVVTEEDGTRAFDGGLHRFAPEEKSELLALLRRTERQIARRGPVGDDLLFRRFAVVLHGAWLDACEAAQPPTIVTAEGDPMEFGKVVYGVLDRGALVAALDACPEIESDDVGGYHWFEGADGLNRRLGSVTIAGGRLTLEVTSRQRAERGRALLARVAGASLPYRSARYESVEEAMARREIRSAAEGAAVDPRKRRVPSPP